MSVLVIRSQKRFAVRRGVSLETAEENRTDGLLIEISTEGCRISGLGETAYPVDSIVDIDIEEGPIRKAVVRWCRNGLLGLKFANALHHSELCLILGADRASREDAAPIPRYGT